MNSALQSVFKPRELVDIRYTRKRFDSVMNNFLESTMRSSGIPMTGHTFMDDYIGVEPYIPSEMPGTELYVPTSTYQAPLTLEPSVMTETQNINYNLGLILTTMKKLALNVDSLLEYARARDELKVNVVFEPTKEVTVPVKFTASEPLRRSSISDDIVPFEKPTPKRAPRNRSKPSSTVSIATPVELPIPIKRRSDSTAGLIGGKRKATADIETPTPQKKRKVHPTNAELEAERIRRTRQLQLPIARKNIDKYRPALSISEKKIAFNRAPVKK